MLICFCHMIKTKDELFERQKCKYGSGFLEDLNNFRLSNQNYKFRGLQILKYRIGKYLIYKPVFRLKSFLS